MLFIFARLFLRMIILTLTVFSIVYFYVLKYSYIPDLGFMQTIGVYSVEGMGLKKGTSIVIDEKNYSLVDDKISLHGLLDVKSCGNLQIGNYKKYICYDDKKVSISYIDPSSVRVYKVNSFSIFNKLKLNHTNDIFSEYEFEFHNLKFIYYKNGDLVYYDDLGAKKLLNLKNINFVGYNRKGLFYIYKGSMYFMQLNNN